MKNLFITFTFLLSQVNSLALDAVQIPYKFAPSTTPSGETSETQLSMMRSDVPGSFSFNNYLKGLDSNRSNSQSGQQYSYLKLLMEDNASALDLLSFGRPYMNNCLQGTESFGRIYSIGEVQSAIDRTCSLKINSADYCSCIQGLQVDFGKDSADRKAKFNDLKNEVATAFLTEKVARMINSFEKNTFNVSYENAMNPGFKKIVEQKGQYSCDIGSMDEVIKKISASSEKRKQCLSNVNMKMFSKFYNARENAKGEMTGSTNTKSPNYKRSLVKPAMIEKAETFNDFINMMNNAIDNNAVAYLRTLNIDGVDSNIKSSSSAIDNEEIRVKIAAANDDLMRKYFKISLKLDNDQDLSNEDYQVIQKIYFSNPNFRTMLRQDILDKKQRAQISQDDQAKNHRARGLALTTSANNLSNNDKLALLDIVRAYNNGIKKDQNTNISSVGEEKFLELSRIASLGQAMQNQNSCNQSIKELENFCDMSIDQIYATIPPADLFDIANKKFDLDLANLDNNESEYEAFNEYAGLLGSHYCAAISCSDNTSSEKKMSSCVSQVIATGKVPDLNDGQRAKLQKLVDQPSSLVRSVSEEEPVRSKMVFDAKEAISDEIRGGIASVSNTSSFENSVSNSGATSGYYEGAVVDEAVVDTGLSANVAGIVGNITNDVSNMYSYNNGDNGNNSLSSGTKFSNSAISTATASVETQEAQAAQASAQAQSVNDKYYEELRKELEGVKNELKTSKSDKDALVKELADVKNKQYLAEQDRIMKEKEAQMQSTINSLESKIRNLENKEAKITQQVKNKESKPSSYFSDSYSTGSGIESNYESKLTSNNKKSAASISSAGSSAGSLSSAGSSNSAVSARSRSGSGIVLNAQTSSSGQGGGQPVLQLTSFNDPSLSNKVKEAYQKGVGTLYVNVGGNVYRVTPKVNSNGEIIEENGVVKLDFEITTKEIAEAANQKFDGALEAENSRLPASIVDEEEDTPVAELNPYSWQDAIKVINESKK